MKYTGIIRCWEITFVLTCDLTSIIILLTVLFQGGYSPTGNMSEMYGSIGNYSTNYGQMNYSTGTVPWRENHGQLT